MNIKENHPIPNAIMDVSFLELFIINTISFFDLFDYPLSLMELYNYLYTGGMDGGNYSLTEIKKELDQNKKLKKIITTKSGFYFLKGRQKIVTKRLANYVIADYKIKIAHKAIKLFRYVPGIKLVAICNNLAFYNASSESDIDLFVITNKDRIWLTRFILVIIISLLGLRPPKDKVKDKICLSFYITQDNLDISNIKIANDDIYLIYWLASLMPIYQRENYYQKFIKANNWIIKYLPNYKSVKLGHRYNLTDNNLTQTISKFKEKITAGKLGAWLNELVKKYQLNKMSQLKKDLAVRGDKWVIINDQMLKFHENDKRQQYLEQFEDKRQKLIDQI